MRPPTPRARLAAAALATALGLGTAACTKEQDTPASPATTASPASSGQRPVDANTVPPGVSGQGSKGGTGQGQSTP